MIWKIINFDALTYAGNLENLAGLEDHPHYAFIKGDISNVDDVEQAVAGAGLDAIVNFAAESHVDRSLHFGPSVFIQTNILGTQVLLDAARKHKVPRVFFK